MSKFYITTPIYYVNDKPHIGHAYTTVLADVISRYHRLMGDDTHFLTGTDEHGQKVWEAANEAGVTPQEQCDRTVVRFQELWKRLEITHDDFIRTTEARHVPIVQETLQDLFDRGEIYVGEYEGWYSVSEERFYTEKELVDGKSPEGKDVERITEKNYFFKMGSYQQWLIDHIEANPEFIQPDYRRNETLGFLRKPLGDLCISRPKSRMPWGIELPFDSDYVCYVWFDALLNYVSAIGYRRDEAAFSRWWPADCHLIGKDILTTHTVYWPTMLKAMGLPMPKSIFAHGWWLAGDEKMSKSLGNVTDPMSIADEHGVDALRYYLMSDMVLGQDATFTPKAFVKRFNSDLANDLGNLVSRCLKMCERHFDGTIPVAATDSGEEEKRVQQACSAAVEAMPRHVREMSLDRGIDAVLAAVRETNRYFATRAPWQLAKEEKHDEMATVLYTAAEALRIVSGLLYPVIPDKMSELRRSLGLPENELEPKLDDLARWGALPGGRKLGPITTLFERIKLDAGEKAAEREANKAAKQAKKAKKDQIKYDDFAKLDLRVAEVVSAERVPKTDKLLRLDIVVGGEQRQIVAGIAEQYTPEDMVGRKIAIVANLEPAKIRGVESNGMLLAARGGDAVKLITFDTTPESGSAIS